MQRVRKMARIGSPRLSVFWNGRRNGTTSVNYCLEKVTLGIYYIPSAEMAWSKRGAPVKDCIPAPIVEAQQPIFKKMNLNIFIFD